MLATNIKELAVTYIGKDEPLHSRVDAAVYMVACMFGICRVDLACSCYRMAPFLYKLSDMERSRLEANGDGGKVLADFWGEGLSSFYEVCRIANDVQCDLQEAMQEFGLSETVVNMCNYYITRFPDGEYAVDVRRFMSGLGVRPSFCPVPVEIHLCGDDDEFFRRSIDAIAVQASDTIMKSARVFDSALMGFVRQAYGGYEPLARNFGSAEMTLFTQEELANLDKSFEQPVENNAVYMRYEVYPKSPDTGRPRCVNGCIYPLETMEKFIPYVGRLQHYGIPAVLIYRDEQGQEQEIDCRQEK